MQNLLQWTGHTISLRRLVVSNLNCATLPNSVNYLDLTGSRDSNGNSCKKFTHISYF